MAIQTAREEVAFSVYKLYIVEGFKTTSNLKSLLPQSIRKARSSDKLSFKNDTISMKSAKP